MFQEIIERVKKSMGTAVEVEIIGSVLLGYGLMIGISPTQFLSNNWVLQIVHAFIIGFIPLSIIVSIIKLENKFVRKLDVGSIEKLKGDPIEGRVLRTSIIIASLGVYHYYFDLGTLLIVVINLL